MNHLLFDLDGTLTDPREGIVRSIQYALVTLGRPFADPLDLERFIGPPLADSFRILLDTSDDSIVKSALSTYRERFSRVGIFENHLYPGIPHALRTLRQAGKILYVATSKPAVFARRIIDHFNLGDHFKSIHGPELDDPSPDKASLIRRTLDAENLDPEDVVMIGDREHDILGARRNRVASIAVAWGYGLLDELRGADPHHIVSSLSELLALFGATHQSLQKERQ